MRHQLLAGPPASRLRRASAPRGQNDRSQDLQRPSTVAPQGALQHGKQEAASGQGEHSLPVACSHGGYDMQPVIVWHS